MQTNTDTTTRTFATEVFGRETRFEYSALWIGYALVSMRLVMGWVLLQGGLTKLVTYLDANPANDWTAAGFLLHAIPDGNPLAGFFASMAGNPLVDGLVMWGLTLTGFGLIIGAFVRWNAFWGAAMMMFFWAASLTGGITAGLPVAHGWVVDDHLIYAVLLFGLGAAGAGRILGLDARLETLELVRNNRWLRLLLG
jgi:thiosulfate dehydrogenase [quinone] large subunit